MDWNDLSDSAAVADGIRPPIAATAVRRLLNPISIAESSERDVEPGQRHCRRITFQDAGARCVGKPAGSADERFDHFERDGAGCEVDAGLALERRMQLIAIGGDVYDFSVSRERQHAVRRWPGHVEHLEARSRSEAQMTKMTCQPDLDFRGKARWRWRDHSVALAQVWAVRTARAGNRESHRCGE